MMETQLLSNVAMLCLLVGTLPSIRSAIKNRENLIGFSTIGALVILFGQLLYCIYLVEMTNYIAALLSIPLMIYWTFVVIFSVKKRKICV